MIDATQIFDGTLVQSDGGIPDVSGITGAAITTTAASTNVLNMLAAGDLGSGQRLGIHIVVTAAFTTCTSLQINFQGSASAGGTYVTLLSSPVYPVANLIAGAPIFRYDWPLNQGLNWTTGVIGTPFQYYRLFYTVAGSAETTGAVFSYASPAMDRQQFWVPPGNYTVQTPTGEI